MTLRAVRFDITTLAVDAIVSAAERSRLGNGQAGVEATFLSWVRRDSNSPSKATP